MRARLELTARTVLVFIRDRRLRTDGFYPCAIGDPRGREAVRASRDTAATKGAIEVARYRSGSDLSTNVGDFHALISL